MNDFPPPKIKIKQCGKYTVMWTEHHMCGWDGKKYTCPDANWHVLYMPDNGRSFCRTTLADGTQILTNWFQDDVDEEMIERILNYKHSYWTNNDTENIK